MGMNDTSIKIIQGFVTGSQDSSMAGSFAKDVNDFLETIKGPQSVSTTNEPSGSMGYVLDINYTLSHHKYMTAIITVSGSLP